MARASSESQDKSLINLTNTPEEDEINLSWSPDGEHIAYVRVNKDTKGNLQQELFLIDVIDDSKTSIQLTDTPNDFEAVPFWISEYDIAYLTRVLR